MTSEREHQTTPSAHIAARGKEAQALAEENRRLKSDLDRVKREFDAFAYSVSHDLRAPLRTLTGFSEILLEDYADQIDASGQDYLQRIGAASARIAELVDGLLGLSRLSRADFYPKPLDLVSLADDIIDELQSNDDQRVVTFERPTGLTAFGDPQLLKLALTLLLENAWKFTAPRNHARIELGKSADPDVPSDADVFFIKDNGVGFDGRYVDKLFKPFQRLHAETEFTGLGMGLAKTQRIIHSHGGRIWAEGRQDQGACIFFLLPKTAQPNYPEGNRT